MAEEPKKSLTDKLKERVTGAFKELMGSEKAPAQAPQGQAPQPGQRPPSRADGTAPLRPPTAPPNRMTATLNLDPTKVPSMPPAKSALRGGSGPLKKPGEALPDSPVAAAIGCGATLLDNLGKPLWQPAKGRQLTAFEEKAVLMLLLRQVHEAAFSYANQRGPTKGSFAGQGDLFQLMLAAKEPEMVAFLKYVVHFADVFKAETYKFSDAYASWLKGGPTV